MPEEVLRTGGKLEGCIYCEFIEVKDCGRYYCSEHERYVNEYDPPCKAYVENGAY